MCAYGCCSHDLFGVGADKDSNCQNSVGSPPHAEPLSESLVPDTGLPQPQRETGAVLTVIVMLMGLYQLVLDHLLTEF